MALILEPRQWETSCFPGSSSPLVNPSLHLHLTNLQMANERTFLAWLRTSLSLTTIGIGIVQLFKLQLKGEYEEMTKFGKPIGAGFFLLGILVLLFGCYRFFNVQALLLQDKYPISYFSVLLLVASVFVLVFATVVVVFTQ
ncbi:hypothetical protein DND36_31600 [Pseudomonas savastanoi pv. glycinea]|nr:hypothetical protein DND36_31600 [Pseudomonas savastanoi pv. glycinea]